MAHQSMLIRTLLTVLTILQIHCSGIAQSTVESLTVMPLIQQRTIYLNGGARASVGGKSRTTLKVDLPASTKSWYYSFSTAQGESGVSNLNLAIQLTALSLDPTGIAGATARNIKVPQGISAIDVYLIDEANVGPFERKVDNEGGTFRYYREGSVENTNQAVVDIDELTSGTLYLGLKNPSQFSAATIVFEVVALVRNSTDTSGGSNQAIYLGSLGWKAFERGDYDRCLELSKRALEMDGSLAFVQFNIALCFLIKGENDLATTEYAKAISTTRQSLTGKQTLLAAIDDLKTYMQKFPSQADAQDLLALLEGETR